MLLGKIRKANADNIAVHPGDARDLMDVLPEASISRAFLLYPDPWPKRRHWKRRFVSQSNIDRFARVLKPGACYRFASDIDTYVEWTLAHFGRRPEK